MQTMNKVPNYFRVVTTEREDSADLYLYGYIGQDFWWDDEMNEQSLTDLDVVRSIKDLESKYSRINVRINSPGGSVFHGDPIITALRSSTAEIHTYVDGIAGSMAADIWVIGKVRHMASNSKLMIHSTSSLCWGTVKDMRETAEMLETFDNAAIATFSAATGMDEAEVRERFYDYRDHWVTSTEAKELGLIDKVDTYEVAEPVDGIEKMSHLDLLKKAKQQATKQKPVKVFDDIELETDIFIYNN